MRNIMVYKLHGTVGTKVELEKVLKKLVEKSILYIKIIHAAAFYQPDFCLTTMDLTNFPATASEAELVAKVDGVVRAFRNKETFYFDIVKLFRLLVLDRAKIQIERN